MMIEKIQFRNIRYSISITLIFLMISLFVSHNSTNSTALPDNKDIVVDFHLVKMFQGIESPGEIEVSETITFNNTSEKPYYGPLLVWIPQPLDSYTYIVESEYLDTTEIGPNLYSVQIPVNYSIQPHKQLDLTVNYLTIYQLKSDESVDFDKVVLYDTGQVMFIIFPNEDYEVKGTGIDIIKSTSDLFFGAYVTPHPPPASADEGDMIVLEFSVIKNVEEPEDTNYLLVFVLILIVISIILIIVKLRSKNKVIDTPKQLKTVRTDKKAGAEVTKKSAKRSTINKNGSKKAFIKDLMMERQDLIEEKKTVLGKRKRLKNVNKTGELSAEGFNKLDAKYSLKLKALNKKIQHVDKKLERPDAAFIRAGSKVATVSQKPDEALLERKNTLISVLKNLENDYQKGNIPEDVYQELKNEYRQETLEILKELDRSN